MGDVIGVGSGIPNRFISVRISPLDNMLHIGQQGEVDTALSIIKLHPTNIYGLIEALKQFEPKDTGGELDD